jgi:hypothetical protein
MFSNIFFAKLSNKSIKRNNWAWLFEDYVKVFIFFWIYIVILSLFSISVYESLKSAFFLIKFFLFFLLISFYAFKKINLNYILKIWFLFVLFLCFDLYFQYIFNKDILNKKFKSKLLKMKEMILK